MLKIDNEKSVFWLKYGINNVKLLGDHAVDFLRTNLSNAPYARNRICAHDNQSDRIHEMLISLDSSTYLRPAKHLDKSESLTVVDGEAELIIFSDNGDIIQLIELAPYGRSKVFYYKIPSNVYHTLLLKRDDFVFIETVLGPHIQKNTIFAPWSPEENYHLDDNIIRYLQQLRKMSKAFANTTYHELYDPLHIEV